MRSGARLGRELRELRRLMKHTSDARVLEHPSVREAASSLVPELVRIFHQNQATFISRTVKLITCVFPAGRLKSGIDWH